MRKRKNNHKNNCNNEKAKYYNNKVYQYIRKNGGWDNWNIIEIERFEAIDGNDARKRERHWIEELKATLNMIIPSRTIKEYHKEYYQDNKEILVEKEKKYREINKTMIADRYKKWYEINKYIINGKIICECGCEISNNSLNRHMKTKKHIDLMS